MKYKLKELRELWKERILKTESEINTFTEQILELKNKRKNDSALLQRRLFESYKFSNKSGKLKTLADIFITKKANLPPGGAGDCAAPKLLQYAFQNNLIPISMAEFWWGAPHRAAIRTHGNFYPACISKCKPILEHMLSDTKVDLNPLLRNSGEDTIIETIFEDEHLIVINKPSGLLSVPGKNIQDSVSSRLSKVYPESAPYLIVHRLDQDTSGLMLIAKTKTINEKLQKQFIKRSITKKYEALLSGEVKLSSGEISLPLRGDLDNRPSQLVCYEHGKKAITKFRVLNVKSQITRIQFYPITGRTHQLRVHAAHSEGLNTPIVGDSMYGKSSSRLHLHAQWIQFTHPISGEQINFTAKTPF